MEDFFIIIIIFLCVIFKRKGYCFFSQYLWKIYVVLTAKV